MYGLRSRFRDWCGEETSFAREVVEAALAHSLKDKAEAAYHRGDAPERRRELTRGWSLFAGVAGYRNHLFRPWVDPFATDPHAHADFVKEGPHLMIIMPDKGVLNSLSTNPDDPVYVMWKDTAYAHIMVKIAPDE